MRHILSVISTILATCALLAAAPTSAAPGDLDTTFGAGFGMVRTAIGTGIDLGNAIALQPDGKIVVAGYCWNGSDYDFCLARYLANGTLDTSFGSGGTVITPIGSANDYGRAIALQPDGKIVVAGICRGASDQDVCLARYQANGSLDTSFNLTGKVISPIGSSGDSAQAIALQPDGKIVVAGRCYNGNNVDFCLARYHPNGALDTSFDSDGKVITPIGSSGDSAQAIALQPDGKIVIAGYCYIGSNDNFCLARYHPNGALDTSFDSDGKVITPIGSSSNSAGAIALQPDGKIVVAGRCDNGGNDDFCLARYQANGTLDTSFGSAGNGKVITSIGSGNDQANALALQPDGKIVVAGVCWNGSNDDFCLARYEGGPFGYQNCKLDIDGDGVVLATTDALILARVALGMTGNAVINGISFASHATRTTWPDIRDYLVSQCGMTLAP